MNCKALKSTPPAQAYDFLFNTVLIRFTEAGVTFGHTGLKQTDLSRGNLCLRVFLNIPLEGERHILVGIVMFTIYGSI